MSRFKNPFQKAQLIIHIEYKEIMHKAIYIKCLHELHNFLQFMK